MLEVFLNLQLFPWVHYKGLEVKEIMYHSGASRIVFLLAEKNDLNKA